MGLYANPKINLVIQVQLVDQFCLATRALSNRISAIGGTIPAPTGSITGDWLWMGPYASWLC